MAESSPIHVVLLGDSTLDNVVWVEDPREAVPSVLQSELASCAGDGSATDVRVTNYAADGFTAGDVLRGNGATISWKRRKDTGDPFPTASPLEPFQPLVFLDSLFPAKPDDQEGVSPTHVLLSVGGNDVRHVLGDMLSLPDALENLVASYSGVLERLLAMREKHGVKVAIMTQYQPCFATDEDYYGVYSSLASAAGALGVVGGTMAAGSAGGASRGAVIAAGSAVLLAVMRQVYAPIMALAAKNRVPVIDLASSLDPKEASLFSHQIEPSAEGGKVIAQLAAHVIVRHDFKGAAYVYRIEPSSTVKGAGAGAASTKVDVTAGGGAPAASGGDKGGEAEGESEREGDREGDAAVGDGAGEGSGDSSGISVVASDLGDGAAWAPKAFT